jgi:hypothetical protein
MDSLGTCTGLLRFGLNYLSNSPAYIAGLSKLTTLTELTLGKTLFPFAS